MNRWQKIALATVLLLVLVLQNAALACPNCKDALAGDPDHAGLVRGYYWSILFMMSMPFLILGGISAYFYHEIRRARARQMGLARPTAGDDGLQPTRGASPFVEAQ